MPLPRLSSSRQVSLTRSQPLPPVEKDLEEDDIYDDLEVDWLWLSKSMDATPSTSAVGGNLCA